MGEKYKCTRPCSLNLENTNQDLGKSTEKKIKINLQQEEGNNNKVYSFGIYAVDESKIRDKDFYFGLGVSLIASSILSSFALLISILKKNDKKS